MKDIEFYNHNLLVIIVLYKQRLKDSLPYMEFLKNPSKNVKWFVYDNSPELDKEMQINSEIKYLHDPSNSGVSKAYNCGAKHAKSIGRNWLLLFDQDTKLPARFFIQLEKGIQNTTFSELYAMKLFKADKMISPSGYKYKRGFLLNDIRTGENSLKNITFLNSGLLLSLCLFEKAGGYDDNVPLYFSDFIFVNRIRKVADSFILLDLILAHDLASNEMSDIAAFKIRYKFYLEGVVQSMHSEQEGHVFYLVGSFLRALKLSIKLKNAFFLKEYWNVILK